MRHLSFILSHSSTNSKHKKKLETNLSCVTSHVSPATCQQNQIAPNIKQIVKTFHKRRSLSFEIRVFGPAEQKKKSLTNITNYILNLPCNLYSIFLLFGN